jgi:predicted DNA-binding transcriptional regulator YafY
MPVNKFALIRYKTIDNCLQNRFRRWTLEDLVEACAEALFEYEGISKGVSKRTVQLDIQNMRSDKIGYNAPIEVIDKRYYRYAEKNYSITNIPITGQDLSTLHDTVEMLKQFKGFGHFKEIGEMVTRLEDKIQKQDKNRKSVIHFERNDLLRGLEFLDSLHSSIVSKKTMKIEYKSFKASKPAEIIFFPYMLKEYRNRWFVVGVNQREVILHLALDRIISLNECPEVKFKRNTFFDPTTFYDDVIGVTKDLKSREVNVVFWLDNLTSPYVITKPLHGSQKVLKQDEEGVTFSIRVVHNFELERELLGFGESIRVLGPRRLRKAIKARLEKALNNYSKLEMEFTEYDLVRIK